MRFIVLGFCAAISLLAAPLSAATVSATTDISHRTTDWTPFILPDPNNAQNSLLAGSQIFEDYLDPRTGTPVRAPVLGTGMMPFDWIHISHDLTLEVQTTGLAGSSGSFQVSFSTLHFAGAGYNRANGIWTSGEVRSVGTLALDPVDFSLFASHAPQHFFSITGGTASFRSLGFPHDQLTPENHPGIRIQELTRHSGILSGSITVTAGYAGEPEPDLGASFVSVSQVPLPTPGLLLGAILLAGAGLRRRSRRMCFQG